MTRKFILEGGGAGAFVGLAICALVLPGFLGIRPCDSPT